MSGPQQFLRGRLTTPESLGRYLLAGRAVITLRSLATQNRATLKLGRKRGDEGKPVEAGPVFFRALAAPDNERDFHYLGCLVNGRYKKAQSYVREFPAAALAALWLARALHEGKLGVVLRQAEVWHEGRCGRCGRALTVPESIESGFGPECRKERPGRIKEKV